MNWPKRIIDVIIGCLYGCSLILMVVALIKSYSDYLPSNQDAAFKKLDREMALELEELMDLLEKIKEEEKKKERLANLI